MRIQYVSDLHLEFGGSEVIDQIGECESDCLVLAGDVSVHKNIAQAIRCIYEVSKKPVIFVPGNHEYYDTSRKFQDEHFRNAWKTDPDVHYLNEGCLRLDGVVFIGATGWWDESYGPVKTKQVLNGMSDFSAIADIEAADWGVSWGKQAHRFFQQELERCSSLNSKIVCISHNAPTRMSVLPHYDEHYLNACYANDWLHFLQDYKPDLWIHGHMHDTLDYCVSNTPVICNPRGYFGIALNKDFDPCKSIQI